MRFVSASYWDLEGEFATRTPTTPARSAPPWSSSTAPAWPRARTSARTASCEAGVAVLDEARAAVLADELPAASFEVRSVERRPYRRRPSPPFITSTFQQEAGRKLRLSSSMAMRSAQSLYEAGYITYMRTDSTTLSETALTAARSEIAERYGRQYVPDERPPLRQEGQERPGGARGDPAGRRHASARPSRSPARSSRADAEVYELIWKRTIASQMTDATGETVTVRLGAANQAGRRMAGRGLLDQRHDHHPPGLPPRLRGRPRRGRRRRRAGAPAARR